MKSIVLPLPPSQAITSLSPPASYPKYPTPDPEACVTKRASPLPAVPTSINFVLPEFESVKLDPFPTRNPPFASNFATGSPAVPNVNVFASC